jgi:small-conductance mechanosensitive channel
MRTRLSGTINNMMLETWTAGLSQSFFSLWNGIAMFLPTLVIAVIIVVIGWIVGSLLGRVVSQVVKSVNVDNALRKAGVEDTLKRGGVHLNSGNFLGSLVRWFIIAVFLVAAFDVLGLVQVNQFLYNVVLLYMPNVIVAVLVLLLAAVIGDALQRLVSASARTAEIKSAPLLGVIARWTIWVFGLLVALSQLGIAAPFIQTLFTGVVVAFSLALGLAFGLGGQEAAARFIEKTRQEITHRD